MIVVGAGLAGLFTALLLQDQGLAVQVLEAKPRVGGRLYTLDTVPGAPEAGGVSIGAAYARLLDLAARLKLKLVPERARTSPTAATTALYYGGRTMAWNDWPSAPANTFPGAYHNLRPFDLPWFLPAGLNPLRSQEDWQDPAFARFDTSTAAWLDKLGFDGPARRAVEATLGYGNSLDDLSAVHLMHVWRFLLNALPGTFGIDGGMQRLPEAMAEALHSPVRLNAAVRAIKHDKAQTHIRLADGQTLSSKAVVLTAPVPALRAITLDPAPTGFQARAIREATMHAVSMFYFAAEKPFWKADGLAPGLWGDHLAERFMPQPAAGAAAVDENPSVFIAYVNGSEAMALDKMSSADAANAVLADLARVRPATKGTLTPLAQVSWQNDSYAGGAYASWRPGQCSTLAPAMPKPLGRVFFAGEHTAVSSRGMEGALESAERVAVEVLTALS